MAPFATLVEWLSAIKASGPLCPLTLGHAASAIYGKYTLLGPVTDGFYRHRFTNVAYTGDAWRIPVYSINETLHLACICLTTSLLHPSFPSFRLSSLIQPHSPCLILAPCLLNALSSRASLRTKHSPSFGGRFALVSTKSLLRSHLSVCPISVATTRRDPSSGLSQMANSILVAGTK